MIDLYLVNNPKDCLKFIDDMDSFYATIHKLAALISGKVSISSVDSALILSRLNFIKHTPVLTDRRIKWSEKHPDCVHQSYEQLMRWTLIDRDSIKKALQILTQRNIITYKSKDSSLFLKFDIPFEDEFDRYIFNSDCKEFWSDIKAVNTMLSIQYLLGGDKTAREAFRLFRYLTRVEGNKLPKLVDLKKDLSMTRDCVLKCLERLQKENFLTLKDKVFTLNYDYITKMTLENTEFGDFIENINLKRQHNLNRLKQNKMRMLQPKVDAQIESWKKDSRYEEFLSDETNENVLRHDLKEELYSRMYWKMHKYDFERGYTDRLHEINHYYVYEVENKPLQLSLDIFSDINFDRLTEKKKSNEKYPLSPKKGKKYKVVNSSTN